jgi:alanine racemase
VTAALGAVAWGSAQAHAVLSPVGARPMNVSRRSFVAAAAGTVMYRPGEVAARIPRTSIPSDRFDPWLEIDAAALRYNVGVISRLARGRPIMAVLKNNGYGLGLTTVASVLEPLPEISGFAVVKTDAAIALQDTGISKPVLLMGLFADADGAELVRRGVRLSLCTLDAAERVTRAVRDAGRPAHVHCYLDTGMSRMGVPYHQALPWLVELSRLEGVRIEGTFMGFTEEPEFDREQLRRFTALAAEVRAAGGVVGQLHAASSNAVFNFPDAHLDLVRPGIALYGGYPSDADSERKIAELRPAVRLRARVVRVARLRPGDSVSYGRNYVASRSTWIATLPVGHADGYARQAVNGGKVLINRRLFPVIGAVSASHTIVELGDESAVDIGDVATLIGPDDPVVHPSTFAEKAGVSVYDVFMHLNPELPKVLI